MQLIQTISELYKLCRKSRLSEEGFYLPRVDIKSLEKNLTTDLKVILKTYHEEFAKDIKRNEGG